MRHGKIFGAAKPDTDTGQYKIEHLSPGTYYLCFSLLSYHKIGVYFPEVEQKVPSESTREEIAAYCREFGEAVGDPIRRMASVSRDYRGPGGDYESLKSALLREKERDEAYEEDIILIKGDSKSVSMLTKGTQTRKNWKNVVYSIVRLKKEKDGKWRECGEDLVLDPVGFTAQMEDLGFHDNMGISKVDFVYSANLGHVKVIASKNSPNHNIAVHLPFVKVSIIRLEEGKWVDVHSIKPVSLDSLLSQQKAQAAQQFPDRPNPFCPSMVIPFDVSESDSALFELYDINGSMEGELFRGYLTEGHHQLVIVESSLDSGIYFVRFTIGDQYGSKRILLR